MTPVYKISGSINTDYSGYKQLCDFYHYCKDFQNTVIHIDFYELKWVDANLAAVFYAMINKLHEELNIGFSTDFAFLRSNFDILFRNGFLTDGLPADDIQKSAVPIERFSCEDKTGFCNYIKDQLMRHRGMPWLSPELEEQIQEDLLEIFCNSNFHANTKDPFFIAGQYYPKLKTLKLTMVDTGDGFLPKIQQVTHGKINTDLEAIGWALEGKSTKLALEKTPGSLGISSILKYVKKHNGVLEIISGSGYWSSSFDNILIYKKGRVLEKPFVGTTINLFFRQ